MPRFVAAILAVVLGVGLFAAIAPEPSFAQERERPQGLFNFLFGGQRLQRRGEPEGERATKPRVQTKVRRNRPARRSAPVEPETPVVEKLPDARVVLVVGDFLGGGLAEGLEDAFADKAGIRVVSRANGSSGFVRDDFYDWPREIGAILDAEKPAAVVIMIGSNDRQQMTVAGQREQKLSPAWEAEYERRTSAIAEAVQTRSLPFVWVGMPSFKSASMTTDMLAFNDIYRQAAEAAGGEFIDIWDGFVDENGAFVTSGPDISGQPVRLRSGDGINLTKSGKRKVAFYAEKPLNRILGVGATPGVAGLAPGALGPPGPTPPDVRAIDRTMPVSLADPELDGGVELLGAGAPAKPGEAKSVGEKLAIEGIAPDSKPGRADDFMDLPQPVGPAPAATAPGSEKTTAIRP